MQPSKHKLHKQWAKAIARRTAAGLGNKFRNASHINRPAGGCGAQFARVPVPCGAPVMEAADLENRRLVRRLARAIAAEEVIGSHRELDLVDKLHPLLEDTAHSVLLGLHPVSCCFAQAVRALPTYES